MSAKKLAQLIGKVFLQSSTLNLLSTVMDTPEFFWSAPDQLQVGDTCVLGRACGWRVRMCVVKRSRAWNWGYMGV